MKKRTKARKSIKKRNPDKLSRKSGTFMPFGSREDEDEILRRRLDTIVLIIDKNGLDFLDETNFKDFGDGIMRAYNALARGTGAMR